MVKNQIFKLLRSTNPPKGRLILALISAMIGSIAALIVPILTRSVIDGTMSGFSWEKGIMIVLVFVVQATLAGVTYYLVSYVGNKVVANLREKLWAKIIYLPISFFDSSMSGETVSRVINDTNILKELVSERIINFVTGIFTLIASVIILFTMDWQMTAIILLAIPLAAIIIVPLGKKIYQISIETQNKTASFTGDISQSLGEMKLVKSSNAESVEIDNANKSVFSLFKFGVREAKINSVLHPLISGLLMLIIFGIIAYGGIRVSSGTLSAGTLMAFILYLFQIIAPITDFGAFFTQVQKAKGATQRIVQLLEMETEELDHGTSIDINNQNISFKNVSFEYEAGKPVLNNLSFEAKPNETIAFAGPSGSGKSTTFALLEQFYQPSEGSIYLGDTPINEISLKSWRSQIGYVPQESSLFATTIRENLCYGLEREISEEELWNVVELACAKEVIENLPNKFDTLIGERGMKLSGGERQRIAIARAFLRNPKVLLLDEATASLDSQSEGVVQEALSNLMKGRTTFVIAHRLSTIVDANQIVFIEHGNVTGIGTHEELVEKHDLYAKFARQQLSD